MPSPESIESQSTAMNMASEWDTLAQTSERPRASDEEQLRHIFTPENVKNYEKDRYDQNLEMLEDIGNTHLTELYRNLMDEYPELRKVVLINQEYWDKPNESGQKVPFDNACFNMAHNLNPGARTDEKDYVPAVLFNFSHPENYVKRWGGLLPQSESDGCSYGALYYIKRFAFETGTDWRECAKNSRFGIDTVLLHEFGHAHDYLRREMDLANKNSSAGISAEVISRIAGEKMAEEAEEESRSPFGGLAEDAQGDDAWGAIRNRLKIMGINNKEECHYAYQQSYRDRPAEKYADDFAYGYMTKNHFEDYFTDRRVLGDERILLKQDSETKLDLDYVHILGLRAGLGVEIGKVENGKVKERKAGFLAQNIYDGKSLYLYENGDPKNPGQKTRISGVNNLTLRTHRDPETGRIRRKVVFSNQNGEEYNINRSKDEPPEIRRTIDDLMNDYSLEIGDQVQFLAHRRKDKSRLQSYNHINQVMDMKIVARHSAGTGWDALILENEDGREVELPAAGLTSKWKTYNFAHYEILPLGEVQ